MINNYINFTPDELKLISEALTTDSAMNESSLSALRKRIKNNDSLAIDLSLAELQQIKTALNVSIFADKLARPYKEAQKELRTKLFNLIKKILGIKLGGDSAK